MSVTLIRKPLTKEQREVLIEAVMSGQNVEGSPELEAAAMEAAERLPELLQRAGIPDTSENRRALLNLVMVRWGAPKTPPRSMAYRKLARR